MPISHLGLAVPDIERAKAYYEGLVPIIGFYVAGSRELSFHVRPAGGPGVPLFFYLADEAGDFSPKQTGLRQLTFIVRSRSEVERANDWAVAQGSPITQEPHELDPSGPTNYSTSWHDPHGFPVIVAKVERGESDALTGGRGYGIGRLVLNVTDLEVAKKYYDELMPLVDLEPFERVEGEFVSYRPTDGIGIRLVLLPAEEAGNYSRHRPGFQHAAFMVSSREDVNRAYEWARAQGSEIVRGKPRDFPQYVHRPGLAFYAVYWHDLHGFMLETVCHRAENS